MAEIRIGKRSERSFFDECAHFVLHLFELVRTARIGGIAKFKRLVARLSNIRAKRKNSALFISVRVRIAFSGGSMPRAFSTAMMPAL